MQAGHALSMIRRRFRPPPADARVTAVAIVAVLVLPLAYLAAATPSEFTLILAAAAMAPVALMAGMRLPLGVLLTFALVAPPLIQFVVQGSPEGIPVASVLPIIGVEFVLLLRGLPNLRYARRLAVVETTFLLAMLYAAVIGLMVAGDRRVWLGEFIEASNLVAMLWLLRLNRIRFADLRPFVLVGHLMAFPFFAWYVATRFGEYRVDFFFGLSTTLVPMTVAVLLHTRTTLLLRGLLLASCLVMLIATAASGTRGGTVIALFEAGLVVMFSLRRRSGFTLVASATAIFTLLLFQPFLLAIAGRLAPDAVERFSTVADSPTLSVRLLEAQDAVAAFKARPGGHGMGAILVTRHEIVWGETGITIEYAPTTFVHNSYAWYLAKTGVIGFAALMLMLAAAVVAAIRRLPTTRGSAGLALAMLVAFLTGAWGGPTLHGVFYTPLLALAIHLARESGEPLLSPVTREAAPSAHLNGGRVPALGRSPGR